MHTMSNTIRGQLLFPRCSRGRTGESKPWLRGGCGCVWRFVLLFVYGPEHLSRKYRKQEEPVQPRVYRPPAPRVV